MKRLGYVLLAMVLLMVSMLISLWLWYLLFLFFAHRAEGG